MLDAILTLSSVAIALYVGFRMFRRSLRAVWASVQPFVSSILSSSRGLFGSRANNVPPHSNARSAVAEPRGNDAREPFPAASEPAPVAHNPDDGWKRRVAIMAVMRDDNSEYFFTKDEIAAKIGKRRSTVLAEIDLYRPSTPKIAQQTSYTRAELETLTAE